MSDKDKIINNLGGVPFSEYDTSYDCENESLLLDLEFKPKRNDLNHNNPEVIWGYNCEDESITIEINVDTNDDSRVIRLTADAFYGSSADGTIEQSKTIWANASYGSSANSIIKIASSLRFNGYHGSYANGKIYVPILLWANSSYGSEANSNLYLIKQLWHDSSYGSAVKYEIVLPKILEYNASYGAQTSYNIAIPKFINVDASYGSSSTYELVVSEANYIIAKYGSSATYNFYKYKNVNSVANYGAYATQSYQRDLIKIRVNASYGAYLKDSTDKLFIEFITRLPCSFDLPKKYNNADIDLAKDIFDTNLENPETWIRVEGSLSRKPVFFGFEASYGARMVEQEKIKFNFSAYNGSVGDTTQMNMYDPDISFCIGNTILNGLDVMIDFNTPNRSCRFAKGAYFGAKVNYTLIPRPIKNNTASYGASATFKFVQYYKYNSSYGAGATFYLITDKRLNTDVAYGAYAAYKLRSREYIASYGAYATFKLSMIYMIEFLEDGCLENEDIPTNTDGTINYDKIRTQAIEGENYKHTIKRRVFY